VQLGVAFAGLVASRPQSQERADRAALAAAAELGARDLGRAGRAHHHDVHAEALSLPVGVVGDLLDSPLDGEMVGQVGDRGAPLSLAAGTLLLGLHCPMAARSTQRGGSAGFLATQAIFAT